MTDKSCEVIETLENEWRDALCRKDMERLRALVHPDFVLIGSRSSGPFMMGRDEWLDAIQRRDVDAIDLEVRDATALERRHGRHRPRPLAGQVSRPDHRGLRAPDRRLGARRGTVAGDPAPFDAGARGRMRKGS